MRGRAYDPFKRAADIVIAGTAIVILAPLLAAVGVAVAVGLGRPVLFSQPRPGRDGRIFVMRKFRSMRPRDPARGLDSDAQRLTRFGRTLRASSLDELPALWNVLRGEMSIVGPRPLLVQYLERYTPEQARRHEVRPGITGLAQVSGRNALSWEERFELDIYYVDNRSPSLDVRIILRTIAAVASRTGVSGSGSATMTEFNPHGGERHGD